MQNNPTPSLRILFAGTPEFAVPALKALIDAGLPPVTVLTQPDRPAGRGRKLQPSPVKACAQKQGIEVLQPETLRGSGILAALQRLEADLMVVAAYGLILPQDILDLPRFGCWNIHASLLPRWRGAAPIQRAIEAGDEETGVCIMQMEAGLDTGPVYARRCTRIRDDETGGSLHDRLASMGADALLACVKQLIEQRLPAPEPQNHALATYAHKLDKAEARIDWTLPAVQLERRVRAFNPWPVAWCELRGERLRVWRARAIETGSTLGPPGQVIAAGAGGIDISAGQGGLRLLEVQRPGGRRMPAADFLRAHGLTPAQ
jgi:methionyl-tRNA formyltransferase